MAARAHRKLFLGGVAMAAIAMFAGVAGVATRGSAQTAAPSSSPTPAFEASTPAPEVPRPAAQTRPEPVEIPMAVPFGPITAEPYRVKTGDGDCLNVRPSPGTTFKSDPRTCVPEGFLLWLYGAEVEADGHKWRYALGEGWVATQYVVPAPGATSGFGPFASVVVSSQAGEVTKMARVNSDGSVEPLPTIPDAITQLGDRPPAISPDGRWAAYGGEFNYVPTLVVRNMSTGSETSYPQAHFAGWSPKENRLLITISTNCPQQCTWTPGWMDPREGVAHKLTDRVNSWGNTVWAPDGETLYAIDENALIEVTLDGDIREIVKLAENSDVRFGQLAVSPDGTKLLSSPFQGAIVIVDIATGRISKVERAPQIPVGGRCGGSIGSLTTWLDANTVIWHESYAEKGGNGITISRADGSGRKLIPFFTVSDIRAVAPNLVSFSTWEDLPEGKGVQLSWLLDTVSGEARPVTVGSAPVWEE